MKTALKLGRCTIKNDTLKHNTIFPSKIRRGHVEQDIYNGMTHYYEREISKHISFRKFEDVSLDFFKSVERHNDDHFISEFGMVKFVSIVLCGSGVLNIFGSKKNEHKITKSIELKKGDIFILNPRISHSYDHKRGRFCAMLSFVVTGAKIKKGG